MNPTGIPPGWHPDPGDPSGSFRWWDGSKWTAHVHRLPAGSNPAMTQEPTTSREGPPPWDAQASTSTASGWSTRGPWDQPAGPPPIDWGAYGMDRSRNQSFVHRNRQSVYAIGLAIVYMALSLFAHWTVFGIVPIFLAMRALRSKEPLAPVAMAAAVLTTLVALTVLTHH